MRASFIIASGLFGLGFLAAPSARAQRVLLRSDVAQDTLRGRFGPNRAYYNHVYGGYAAVVGAPKGSGADLQYGESGEFFLGFRNKFRLTRVFSTGFDLRYDRLGYSLKQNDQKVLPNALPHYSEVLALQQIQTEAFVRFNFGRRGNAIGRYLDLTGWGGWVAGSVHRYEDRPGAAPGTRKIQVSEHGLEYVRRWPYGAGARLGSGRYGLIGRYRLSSTFVGTRAAVYPELPRWTIGLELGWL